MKIFQDIPTSKDGQRIELSIPNDSIILKLFKKSIPVFIIISSITVFLGVKSSISDYTINWSSFALLPLYGFILYLAYNLDSINSKLTGYTTATIMDKENRFKISSIFLTLFCCLTIVGLTYFSYSFSQFSGVKIGSDITQDANIQSTSFADSTYHFELSQINDEYNEEKESIDARYAQMILSDNSIYNSKIVAEKAEIKRLKKVRVVGKNHKYIDNKVSQANKRISNIRALRATSETELRTNLSNELGTLRNNHTTTLSSIGAIRDTTHNKIHLANSRAIEKEEQTESKLSGLLGFIAGKSIIIVLVLSVVYEIAKQRNGIKAKPVFESFDFSESPINEILSFPRRWILYKSLNFVRSKNLPTILEPSENGNIYDNSYYTSDIKTKGNTALPHHISDNEIEIQKEINTMLVNSDQLEKSGKIEDANKLRIEANDLIKMYYDYRGLKASDSDVSKFANDALNLINGTSNFNPFEAVRKVSNPIGFFNKSKSDKVPFIKVPFTEANNTANNTGNSGDSKGILYKGTLYSMSDFQSEVVKTCRNCGGQFVPLRKDQQSCVGDCTKIYHTEKHGKQYNPNFHRNK